jgi:hypothetical protein
MAWTAVQLGVSIVAGPGGNVSAQETSAGVRRALSVGAAGAVHVDALPLDPGDHLEQVVGGRSRFQRLLGRGAGRLACSAPM